MSSSTPTTSRIHRLPHTDAAVLAACAEFPTFSDALATVAQAALPALEKEVWGSYLSSPLRGSALSHDRDGQRPSPHRPAVSSVAQAGSPASPPRRRGRVSVEASVCLPAFAWDIERSVAFPFDDDKGKDDASRTVPQRGFGHACEVAHPPPRKRSRAEGAPAADAPSDSAPLDLLRRLASICTDVSVSVWLLEPPASGGTCCHEGKRVLPAPYVCFEKRWHCGQEMMMPAVVGLAAPAGRHTITSRPPFVNFCYRRVCAADQVDEVFLRTRCCVRGLFHNLPLRQAAFQVTPSGVLDRQTQDLLHSSLSSRWAATSASAQRTRREEQQHLFAVLFQTAVCTVLAPLYLHANPCASHEAAATMEFPSVFTARLLRESNDSGGVGGKAKRETSPFGEVACHCPSALPPPEACRLVALIEGACTDDNLSSLPDRRGTRQGLFCDRFGVCSGRLTVQQAQGMTRKEKWQQLSSKEATQTLSSPETRWRGETQGEATAEELCAVFGIDLLLPRTSSQRRQTAQKRRSFRAAVDASLHDGDEANVHRSCSRFTEVVMQPGKFAVIFHAFSKPCLFTSDAAASSASPPSCSSVRRSPHFSLSSSPSVTLSDGRQQHPATFLILTADSKTMPLESTAFPTGAVWPTRRVLEPDHWAYDVVAAQSRSLRGRFSSLVIASPVFIFVDAAYVPTRLCECRQRQRTKAQQDSREGAAAFLSSFSELYAAAVERVCPGGRPSATTEETLDVPASEKPSPQQQPTTPCVSLVSGKAEPSTPAADRRIYSLSPTVDVPTEAAVRDSAAATADSHAGERSGEVGLRMQYVFQRVLEAAAAPGTQSFIPSASKGSATPAPWHRVRLAPATLWMNATGCGGRAKDAASAAFAAAPAALPRRTPVSLHPKLSEIILEEAERAAAFQPESTNFEVATAVLGGVRTAAAAAAAAAEGRMARMRHLLDTGRGSVLRQLPRACNPPQPWSPADRAAPGTGDVPLRQPAVTPPIGSAQVTSVSVLPWARKFILLAQRPCGVPEAASSRHIFGKGHAQVKEAETAPPSSLLVEAYFPQSPLPSLFSTSPHPRHLRWWVLDQHAVHERVRLEFFLCFADTYVQHPELPQAAATHRATVRGTGKCSGVGAASAVPGLSRHARHALERRQQNTRLLRSLVEKKGTSSCVAEPASPSAPHAPSLTALASFPVLIPAEWRLRVSLVESHLLQWGWRFQHELVDDSCRAPFSDSPRLATAVRSWPCVEVEGVEHRVTSLRALTDTVEELEALGAAATPTSASSPLLSIPSAFLRFFISRSCRGALMFGDAVTPAAARHMVAALECVEQYYVCSHGRPSFASLAAFNA
ncbi:hypothetical protein ABB37_07939 [Leptomonas pyrrhocoris]|uniref:MutL C-terminal dimerisation domain-containing protein n=1 Tax=Leptomonas pyrrhocoris TaxID=157538 RepID=A0A0M9FU73_LEPPY|nr:hypothetical protein ABB37_07939 [Leptomonas pyrrhocoris]KPA76180.1 hypothetical protein ABB37_07939 [Leptomonas pyrrhocoris]|eukprot:XP_015654619.1 hypothetical protein ABB37_07939 [Leptomonas pyrrhocoris]